MRENEINYCTATCPYSDGCVYTSLPPKIKCTLNNKFYLSGELCSCKELIKEKKENNMEENKTVDLKSGDSITVEDNPPKKKALVVNLFGQPGAGKSSGTAYVFSKLKMAGVNAEMALEFAKEKVWEESVEVFKNQAYIFGKQYFRLSRVKDKVDVIVVDSPLLLSCFYNTQPELGEHFTAMVQDVFNSFDNYNVFINRVKPYNPAGRFQTEEESDNLVEPMRKMLKDFGVTCVQYPGSEEGYDKLVKDVLNILKKN